MSDVSCPQPDCQIAVSGRCLEGFDPPDTCPHQREQNHGSEEPNTFGEQELFALPTGEALTDEQASVVTAAGPTKLIVIAGPYGSGKTTVITALFEAFQEAPFGNYSFRGSRTLVGFERRCHLGRRESGQEVADTSHTSMREGVVFLHLDLSFRRDENTFSENLLLSDISGELFKRVRDVGDAAEEIRSLYRADHLCIVVDGEKLADKASRQVARNDSRSILRSIIEAGILSPLCIIDLAITKWDVLLEAKQSQSKDEIDTYLRDTIRSIQAVATDRVFQVFHVAARPPVDAKVPFAHGLPTLLRSWMDHDQTGEDRPVVITSSNSQREMNRFTGAVLSRTGLEGAYNVVKL